MKYTVRVVLALASLVLSALPPRVEAIPLVSVGSATVEVGDTFTIPVSIADAVELISWQFDLSFNPLLLQANLVTEGPFMSSFGTTFFVPGVIDNGSGLISLVSAAYVDLPPNPSGDGLLANVEFTAISAGTSPLTLSNVFLNFQDSGFDVANGEVCVNPPAATPCEPDGQVPEPGTVALFAIGLAVLASRRRWTGTR